MRTRQLASALSPSHHPERGERPPVSEAVAEIAPQRETLLEPRLGLLVIALVADDQPEVTQGIGRAFRVLRLLEEYQALFQEGLPGHVVAPITGEESQVHERPPAAARVPQLSIDGEALFE